MIKPFEIMGILNATPDSFFDGGNYAEPDKAIERALEMEAEGADIIDIGGESSRPGSKPVSPSLELERVLPVIEGIRKCSSVKISIDTQKSAVASKAISAGADMINDISAGRNDPLILELAAKKGVPICLMHMRGRPENMQEETFYEDLIGDITSFFLDRFKAAKGVGIRDKNIILDPGIGFGKDAKDNLKLLRGIKQWKKLGFKILVGPSNKSFIGKLLGCKLNERLEGTLSVVGHAYKEGADVFRVHNVASVRRFLEMEGLLA